MRPAALSRIRTLARQRVGGGQQLMRRLGEPCAAATRAADHALDQRHASQIRQRIERLPRGLVAHADNARGLRDRPLHPDLAQDGDAPVGPVLPERLNDGKLFSGHAHHHAASTRCPILLRYSLME